MTYFMEETPVNNFSTCEFSTIRLNLNPKKKRK